MASSNPFGAQPGSSAEAGPATVPLAGSRGSDAGSAEGQPPVIAVRNLKKTYHTGGTPVQALRGVSLEVRQGEMVALMGPSGSGKSTFLNLLGCLDRPSAGSYRLLGEEVARLDAERLAIIRNRHIGFVFQSFNLLPRTDALGNVELPMVYAGIDRTTRRRRAAELLDAVGMGHRMQHVPAELSGGQQQRV